MIALLLFVGLMPAGWAVSAALDEPEGLRLPAGFHASVVAEGLGAIRRLAVRNNGDIYLSTARAQQGNGKGARHRHPLASFS